MEEVLLFEDPIQVGPEARVHDVLVAIYRNSRMPLHTRMRAAIAAIAYESPKLAVTALVSEKDFASLLERRIAHMRKVNAGLIESRPAPQVEIKPHLPSVPDRRFRRRF
jgi:hypothetical protein